MAAYQASGLTQWEFAERNGLKLATLQGWLHRRPDGAAQKQPWFREFRAVLPGTAWGAEVSLRDGTVVRLSAAAAPEWIDEVLQILRRTC
jgi:hypothetical protein